MSSTRRASDGILEVEYGYYPQQAVDNNMQRILENSFQSRTIKTTGNTFTVDSRKYNEYDKRFSPRTIDEYEYQGKRYVRVIANSCFDGSNFKLSNGESYKDGDAVWVEVSPVKWLVDEDEKIMLSEKLLFAGVQFKHKRDYKGNFSTTDIKRFMDKDFSKDLVRLRTVIKAKSLSKEEIERMEKRQNPYQFNFDNVSEEEIIKGALESNIAVFLHGRSSEGKSARVKQFDPDCEIIYLRNATPESLNGKSVYVQDVYETRRIPYTEVIVDKETNEKKEIEAYKDETVLVREGFMYDVKPSWLEKLEKKCEEEPNKIHIVFFDEITNALPSIQGMAFNIVLDKEVNGKWKLPSNARIVAAGNDLNDSLAANTLAEPLFNRFAHVYINTTTDSWLKWACIPKTEYERLDYKEREEELTIHPSIYAYIAYKSYSRQDVLRTPYNGEKPNADPRKWEMASKVLYATKKPEMLRALIGEELTRDFTAFVRQRVITVEDVLNGNYSNRDLEMNAAEKFATAVGLSSVDDDNFGIVRDFMKHIGAEPRAVFESMWACKDERRLEKIAELQMEELSDGGMRL